MSLKPNELLQQQINLLEDANSALTDRLNALERRLAELEKDAELTTEQAHAAASEAEGGQEMRLEKVIGVVEKRGRVAVLEAAEDFFDRTAALEAVADAAQIARCFWDDGCLDKYDMIVLANALDELYKKEAK